MILSAKLNVSGMDPDDVAILAAVLRALERSCEPGETETVAAQVMDALQAAAPEFIRAWSGEDE